jgi:hypothetical protein
MCLLFNDTVNVWLHVTAVIGEWTSMEHQWNDIDSGKPTYLRKSWSSPTHIIHHKFHMDWPVVFENGISGKVLGRMKKVQRCCLLVLWKCLVNTAHRAQCFVSDADWRKNHWHSMLNNRKAVSCGFCAALYVWKTQPVCSYVAYRLVSILKNVRVSAAFAKLLEKWSLASSFLTVLLSVQMERLKYHGTNFGANLYCGLLLNLSIIFTFEWNGTKTRGTSMKTCAVYSDISPFAPQVREVQLII